RRRSAHEENRIEAPAARPVEKHEEKYPAIKDRELAVIGKFFSSARDREKFCHRRRRTRNMNHEVGVGERTAANERGQTRQESESNHEPPDQHDPSADLGLSAI